MGYYAVQHVKGDSIEYAIVSAINPDEAGREVEELGSVSHVWPLQVDEEGNLVEYTASDLEM